MHEQGATVTEIAEALKISRNTAWKDLKTLEEQWIKDGMMDMQRVRMREFREIRMLREEAWEAWKKSKEPGKEVIQEERKAGTGKGSKSSRASVKTTNTPGNPRFLQVIKEILSLEADLIGTKVPKILDTSGEEGAAAITGGVIMMPAWNPPDPPPKGKGK
jgi:DNA-binding Lrp family transcriptional regulator